MSKSKVTRPVCIDDLSEDELREIIVSGLKEVSEGKGEPIDKVYKNLKKEFDL